MSTEILLATPAEICRELGSRLRAHRLLRSMTQEDTATRAGVALNAVKKLERDGQTNVLTLVRVASVLGLLQEMEPLFRPHPPSSIAAMERAERPRKRARRGPA